VQSANYRGNAITRKVNIMSQPISITIRLPVETRKMESGVFASCQFLDVSCVGGSTGDALNDLAGLLTRHLGACFEIGRFDELFRCSGYSALEKDLGSAAGRFLDIGLKLGIPKQAPAMLSPPPAVASSMLSTWMT
jgi:hypothetical protein